MPKVALITGITGQDGAYLAELLLAKGYEVHGVKRRASSFNTARIDHLYQDPHTRRCPLSPALWRPDRRDQPDPHRPGGAARRDLQPGGPEPRQGQLRDAGIHRQRRRHRHAAPARGDPHPEARRHHPVLPGQHLRAVRRAPRRRRSETTPFLPQSPYATAKLYAYWITRNYRDGYGLFAANGILFNHESPLPRRDLRHPQDHPCGGRDRARPAGAPVDRQSRRQARLGPCPRLCRGHVAHSPARGRRRLRARHRRGPYRARVRRARLRRVGRELVWKGQGVEEKGVDRRTGKLLVEIDPRYFRPLEVDHLLGDPAKARRQLGWRHTVGFADLVAEMVAADLDQIAPRAPGQWPARRRCRRVTPLAPATPFDLAGRRVFVAGHRGMVGSALLRRLAARAGRGGHRHARRARPHLRGRRRGLDARAASRTWSSSPPPGSAASWPMPASPVDFLADNLRIELNLIRAAHAVGVAQAPVPRQLLHLPARLPAADPRGIPAHRPARAHQRVVRPGQDRRHQAVPGLSPPARRRLHQRDADQPLRPRRQFRPRLQPRRARP